VRGGRHAAAVVNLPARWRRGERRTGAVGARGVRGGRRAAHRAVVARGPVRRVVDAVLPGADVRHYVTLAEMWRAVVGPRGEAPMLVVLAQGAAGPGGQNDLATALAYLAPRTAVVLLHERDTLEALGEAYLRAVAAHAGDCDPEAPVEVVLIPATGDQLAAALRAATPSSQPVADCPDALSGPLTPEPPTPPTPPRRPRPERARRRRSWSPSPRRRAAPARARPLSRLPPRRPAAALGFGSAWSTSRSATGSSRRCSVNPADRCGAVRRFGWNHRCHRARPLVHDRRLRVSALLAPVSHRDEPELLTGRVHGR
jgi:hypothetical protein